MELITSPSLLFLDEPTTGLDANTANSIMELLQKYEISYPFLCYIPVKAITNLTGLRQCMCFQVSSAGHAVVFVTQAL